MAYRRGLLIVFTGNGKGKTSAAMGTALRAIGQGFKVLMIQFIKGSWRYGELESAAMLGGAFQIQVSGRGFVKVGTDELDPEDVRLAQEGWKAAVEAMQSGKCDMLILDEINNALDFGMISLERVLADLAARPKQLHVICTGRNAPEKLMEAADLVTEMKQIKHPFDSGVFAQKGIEF